jgi:hypothetical protein
MNIDQVIVLGFTLVIFMAVFVFSIDLLSPLFFKWEFDEICRMYLLMAEANNGLSVAMRTELERALDELDLTEITIVCDDYGALKRGNVSAMEVQATFGSNQFVSLFNRTEKKVRFVFKQNFLARKIVM